MASYKKKQQGIATILIVLLIGMSMTAMTIGISHAVKSTQHKQTAVHASTHVQSAAWAAVTVFKSYLKQVNYEDVESLTLGEEIPLTITGLPQHITATVVNVDASQKASAGIRVTANIRAQDQTAQASSSIQVVYHILNAVCNLCQRLSANIDLFDITNLGGDISFNLPVGGESTVSVEGNVNALNIALANVTYLNSTGNVILGSAVPIKEVYINGNLLLDGSAKVNKASVLGVVTLKNNGSGDVIYANGNVEMDGGPTLAVNSRSNVDLKKYASHHTIIAGGLVSVAAPITKVHAKGNILLTQWADARDIATESTLTCVSPYWTMFDSLLAEIALVNCPAVGTNVKSGVDLTIPIMDVLPPYTTIKPVIDAWPLKAQANYAFEYTGGKIRVTVKNVNNIGDGTYLLGRYPYSGGRDHLQYLCDAVDAAGNCTAPVARTKTLCQGHSTSNACFAYDVSAKKWTIDGKNMAPGIVWFEGDLNLANGQYYNTFIATGNLTTAGSLKSYAPNFVGYNAICNNAFPLNATTDFAGLYPTQLCDISAVKLKYSPVGNIAILAGGNNPNNGGAFEGGNITLGASNEMFGSVLASGYFDTGGDTIVHGYVSATANKTGSGANDLAGKTVIDLTNLPSTYKPNEVPAGDGSSCADSCNAASDGTSVLWTRYL